MNDKSEFKRNWRINWLTTIYEFSNPTLQKMSWLEGPKAKWPNDEPWVSDFGECMCSYFDDLGIDKGSYEELIHMEIISTDEANIVKKFHKVADEYNPPAWSDDVKVINDPNWRKVVQEAVTLWNAIKPLLSDENDRDFMESLEKKFGKVGNEPV